MVPARLILRGVSLVVLASAPGCFSGDDFAVCGSNEVCAPDVSPPGDATTGDVGAEPADDCEGIDFSDTTLAGTFVCPTRTLVLSNLTTTHRDGTDLTRLEIHARRIEIQGTLSAHAAGDRGGGGGGGGAGATTMGGTPAGGLAGLVGTGADHEGEGTPGADGLHGGPTAGKGGRGGAGGGGPGEASGEPGLPGTTPGSDGAAGRSGFQVAPGTAESEWKRRLCKAEALPGAGGGGGGGGAGAPVGTCGISPGGGGGGAGTPGGGALLLYATEAISVAGRIDVSGGNRQASPPEAQTGRGPCGVTADCEAACDEGSEAGQGGRGGSSANTGHAGAPGGAAGAQPPGGRGGDGGLGSGGYVLLQAPEIIWGSSAALSLAGGDGSGENPGVLEVFGDESNARPTPVTPAFLCDPRPYPTLSTTP